MEENNKEKNKAKDIRRNTAACEVCQERKRKCDGKAPCSFCVSKNLTCKFSQQKKRGPVKKRKVEAIVENTPQLSIVPAFTDIELLDKAEARRYLTLYFRIEHTLLPASQNMETLLSPRTLAHKVQLYSALAYSAQAIGDIAKGKLYISQARTLSGSIYDAPEMDTVRAFMMMRKYWYLVLDFTQCTHYSSLAWSLAKLMKGSVIDDPIRRYCQISAVMSDPTSTNRDKLVFLRSTTAVLRDKTASLTKEQRLLERYLVLAGDFVEHFNVNLLFPSHDPESNFFLDIKDVHLTEEVRLKMLENINVIQSHLGNFKVEEYTSLVIVTRVFCPMYQAVVNWKSGHIAEALHTASECVRACNVLMTANILALVAGYTHICMLGTMFQFLHEHGQLQLADKIEKAVELICRVRGPEYATIITTMAEYRKKALRLTSTYDIPSSPSSPSTAVNPNSPPSPPPPPGACVALLTYNPEMDNRELMEVDLGIGGEDKERVREVNSALDDWLTFYSNLFACTKQTSPRPPGFSYLGDLTTRPSSPPKASPRSTAISNSINNTISSALHLANDAIMMINACNGDISTTNQTGNHTTTNTVLNQNCSAQSNSNMISSSDVSTTPTITTQLNTTTNIGTQNYNSLNMDHATNQNVTSQQYTTAQPVSDTNTYGNFQHGAISSNFPMNPPPPSHFPSQYSTNPPPSIPSSSSSNFSATSNFSSSSSSNFTASNFSSSSPNFPPNFPSGGPQNFAPANNTSFSAPPSFTPSPNYSSPPINNMYIPSNNNLYTNNTQYPPPTTNTQYAPPNAQYPPPTNSNPSPFATPFQPYFSSNTPTYILTSPPPLTADTNTYYFTPSPASSYSSTPSPSSFSLNPSPTSAFPPSPTIEPINIIDIKDLDFFNHNDQSMSNLLFSSSENITNS